MPIDIPDTVVLRAAKGDVPLPHARVTVGKDPVTVSFRDLRGPRRSAAVRQVCLAIESGAVEIVGASGEGAPGADAEAKAKADAEAAAKAQADADAKAQAELDAEEAAKAAAAPAPAKPGLF